ncbi:MAG: hypothetical protein AAF690_07095 [Acidobacteriota bacterium]
MSSHRLVSVLPYLLSLGLCASATAAQEPASLPEARASETRESETRASEEKMRTACAEGLVAALDCRRVLIPESAEERMPRRSWIVEACATGLVARQVCLEGPRLPAGWPLTVEQRAEAQAELRHNCAAGLLPLRFCPLAEEGEDPDVP